MTTTPSTPASTPRKPRKAAAKGKPRQAKRNRAERGLKTLETQREAIALRAAGLTYREIGTALKIDQKWAWQLIHEGIRENIAGDVQHLREEDDSRCIKLLAAAWRPAMAGDTRSILACIRVLERRARLWGLDAPVGLHVSGSVEHEGAVLVIDGDTKDSFMSTLEQARPLRVVK